VTLLIDPPNSPGHGRLWSHLASDESFDELHRFAAQLGIPHRGFDRDHYDIPAERYDQVVAAGATPVSSRELIRRLQAAGLRRRKTEVLRPRRPGQPLVRGRRLVPGDTVAVVAPAGPVPEERLDAGLEVLRSWGLVVREMPHVRGRLDDLDYLAATDASRAADLMAAWCHAEVAAIFCARGGYGVQRMVDLLDWASLAEAGPKPLVGFSDVTALHQAFASRLGVSTVHGPVVTSLGSGDDESRAHLRSMLFEPETVLSLTPEPVPALVPGAASGALVGGTVALLAAEVGTPTVMPAAGGIAVLEDVDEDLYRLDRMLTHLLRAGWFDGVRGIALGQFSGRGTEESLRRLFEDRLVPLGVPTLLGVPVGHTDRNLAMPFGVPATLEADADAGTLRLREPGLL
jgi:muramoyltetrapeptide carboxypeptidase